RSGARSRPESPTSTSTSGAGRWRSTSGLSRSSTAGTSSGCCQTCSARTSPCPSPRSCSTSTERFPTTSPSCARSSCTCSRSTDDVVHGKPDPEGYVKALDLLEADPAQAVVFEDTEAGVASARAAGVGRVLAMRTTLEPHRLAEADELIDRLDVSVMQGLLL